MSRLVGDKGVLMLMLKKLLLAESKQRRGRTLTAVKSNRATRLRSAAAQRIIKQPVRRTNSNESLPTVPNVDKFVIC